MAKQKGNRMIANNKKAYHDYFIEDKYEACLLYTSDAADE